MIKFDFSNILKANIGKDVGLDENFVDKYNEMVKNGYLKIENGRGGAPYDFLELPYQDISEILDYKRELEKYDYFVVVGIGGSSLGGYALFRALKHLNYNIKSNKKLFFIDNSDPETVLSVLDVIEPEKTIFNVITKSGSTAETMSAFSIIFNFLKEKGLPIEKHIVATTDMEKGDLINIAKQYELKTFYIPRGVGGRYSVFTPVGLLPALFVDIDIKALLEGAKEVDVNFRRSYSPENNPILLSALVNYIYDKEYHKNILAMMCYKDKLHGIGLWYQQLWAESLGKKYDLKDDVVESGSTPIVLRGATDQHSVLQLFMEGPNDKLIVFLDAEKSERDVKFKIDELKQYKALSYFEGKTLGSLIASELEGVKYALTIAEKPNYTIKIEKIDEFNIGSLLFAFELQTVIASTFYGVDPFNQPGVEEGKKATYALMGRDGYDEKRKEMTENIKESYKINFPNDNKESEGER